MKKVLLFLLFCFAVGIICDAAPRRRKVRRTRRAVRTVKHVAKPVKLSIHDADPFHTCEDTCAHVHGIDVSHYQNEVFWNAVGDDTNMAYVYLKCTEGSDNQDPLYLRNIELAHSHDLKVGSYHFFRPKVATQQQLRNFQIQCLPAEQDLIPMLDVETDAGMPTEQFCDSLTKMLTLIEEAYHQKPLVYTYRNFYNKHLQGRLEGYPLMIAMYSDEQPKLADGRDYIIWQYTCRGRLAGVKGEVDKSRIMGEHSLRELYYVR
ncbi:MAG: glycosyl hydrolase family 25 [Prevotella sp.]|nr:glycosyl hydrolase family 25 [Prevotella sp.]